MKQYGRHYSDTFVNLENNFIVCVYSSETLLSRLITLRSQIFLWSVSLLAWSEEHRVGIATGAAAQVQTKVIDDENDFNEESMNTL